jgi:shikimate dehydrogenase
MIDGETRILGVIGDPVSHTLSPAIQNAALRHFQINACYFAFRIPRERLRGMTDAIRVLDMPGANVTAPHKEAVLPLLDRVSPEAAAIGAVNTIVNREGVLEGENTDLAGFAEALGRVRGSGLRSALLLGAGGAARAVFAVLRDQGFTEVLVASRKSATGRKMIASLGGEALGRVIPWDQREKVTAELLVNATPLGTNVRDALPVSARVVCRAKAAVDLVVRPKGTRWVALCRSYGIPADEGTHMLIAQGRESFRLWFGKVPPAPVMQRALRAAAGEGE